MARPLLSGGRDRVSQTVAILSAASYGVYHLVQLGNWTERAYAIAFYAGFSGTALMFFRWRLHRDRLAKVLCLVAFGTWMLSLMVGPHGGPANNPWRPSFDVAAAALLIGFGGGIVTLIRLYTHRDRGTNTPPP